MGSAGSKIHVLRPIIMATVPHIAIRNVTRYASRPKPADSSSRMRPDIPVPIFVHAASRACRGLKSVVATRSEIKVGFPPYGRTHIKPDPGLRLSFTYSSVFESIVYLSLMTTRHGNETVSGCLDLPTQ